MFCCVYIPCLLKIYSSIDGPLGCFHILPIINNVTMNTAVHVPLQISDLVSLDMYSRVELLDHMVLVSVFLQNLHTVLHSGYTNLHFHQQCMKIPLSMDNFTVSNLGVL